MWLNGSSNSVLWKPRQRSGGAELQSLEGTIETQGRPQAAASLWTHGSLGMMLASRAPGQAPEKFPVIAAGAGDATSNQAGAQAAAEHTGLGQPLKTEL